nr:family 1 glycosylhydrolase [Enterobacter sp. Cy-643]
MKDCFPEKFWWGTATSATQSEGRAEGDGKGVSRPARSKR